MDWFTVDWVARVEILTSFFDLHVKYAATELACTL